MKLIKKLRKGFTLIELVVVIAVIAVLAAVSVVSYVAITNKAKQSSDEQAVRQMNTALKASGILGAKDINELFDVLSEEGLNAKNYKPLMKDTYFFWDQENNEIVYAKYKDGQYIGIFPESYKDKGKGDHHWFSLSKEIQTVKVSSIQHEGTAYTVKSGEELYSLMTDESVKPTSITLSSDVDLMGADINFKGVETFDGAGKTLENVSQLQHESFDNKQNENSNSGLFGEIGVKNGNTYTPVNTTISNLTIENSVVGSATTKFTGILGGAIRGGSVVNVSNVKIKNCTVYGLQKAGILFGYLADGDVTIESNVEITGCKVATLYGEGGKLFGAAQKPSKLYNKMASFDVTLEALPTDVKMEIKSATGDTIQKGTATAKDVGGYLVHSKSDAKNWEYLVAKDGHKKGDMADMNGERLQSCFRYFNADAILTVVSGSYVDYKGASDADYVRYTASAVQKAVTCDGYSDAITIGALPLTPALMA